LSASLWSLSCRNTVAATRINCQLSRAVASVSHSLSCATTASLETPDRYDASILTACSATGACAPTSSITTRCCPCSMSARYMKKSRSVLAPRLIASLTACW